jgi:transposase-like protein
MIASEAVREMPAPHLSECRRRALDLARKPGLSVAQVAKDLGISESGLRRWLVQDDVDTGRKEGLSAAERGELTRCVGTTSAWRSRSRSSNAHGLLRPGGRAPKIGFPAGPGARRDGFDVAVACRCRTSRCRGTTNGASEVPRTAVSTMPAWRTRSSTSTPTVNTRVQA